MSGSMLEHVDAATIGTVWGPIRKVLEKYTNDWLPEDAYAEIKAGRSQLFMGRRGEDGFIILSVINDFRGQTLWVWFAYGPGSGEGYWPQIREMAQSAGCQRIAFSSHLKFWKEYAGKFGFRPARTVYELDLTDITRT